MKNKFSLPLLKNIGWTLASYSVPLIVALSAIPLLIKNLGVERFGLITLTTTLIGFAGIFDIGLGRSLTNSLIRSRFSRIRVAEGELIGTALALLLTLSALMISLFFVYKIELISFIKVSEFSVMKEALNSVVFFSISIPFVFIQIVGVSLLESNENFKVVSIIRAPTSAALLGFPCIVSYSTSRLEYLVLSIVVAKIIGSVVFLVIGYKMFKKNNPEFCGVEMPTLVAVKSLVSYGGWISVSNVVGPILTNIDRFYIANILGVSALAVYVAPLEFISKISIIAGSVSTVLFVNFSKIGEGGLGAKKIYRQSMVLILILTGIPCFCIGFFSNQVLDFWVGPQYAKDGANILMIFSIGFLVHGLMQPSYTWIQATGRSRTTAAIHIFDLAMYLIYFPILTGKFGVEGAAYAWLLRTSISFIFLNIARVYYQSK